MAGSESRFDYQVTALVDQETKERIEALYQTDKPGGGTRADEIRLAFALALPLLEELSADERREAFIGLRYGMFRPEKLTRRIELASPAA